MTPHPLKVELENRCQEMKALVRRAATEASAARLVAENEPFGDMAMYSLLDDTRVTSDLGARLKIVSTWLTETERLYKDRYDLTEPPSGFKTRFDIFKELVEAAETETCGLWSTEIRVEDRLLILKRMSSKT
jgi:hypothetical protein